MSEYILSTYDDLMRSFYPLIEKFFIKHKIGDDHNHLHAKKVAEHAFQACLVHTPQLTNEQVYAILLAALGHDTDDHKLFDTKEYQNIRKLLSDFGQSEEIIELVVKLIDLVSTTKHKDNRYGLDDWYFIVRYADRLDAIGSEGINRTIQYTVHKGRKLYCYNTPRPTTLDELYEVATIERYNNYKNDSLSMIDHCFDKLLRIGDEFISNPYFNSLTTLRKRQVEDFVLWFGRKGHITLEECWEYMR